MVSRSIDGHQARNGLTSIGHDDLPTVPDTAEIATEVVLELPNADLDSRCSYRHDHIVATTSGAATVEGTGPNASPSAQRVVPTSPRSRSLLVAEKPVG